MPAPSWEDGRSVRQRRRSPTVRAGSSRGRGALGSGRSGPVHGAQRSGGRLRVRGALRGALAAFVDAQGRFEAAAALYRLALAVFERPPRRPPLRGRRRLQATWPRSSRNRARSTKPSCCTTPSARSIRTRSGAPPRSRGAHRVNGPHPHADAARTPVGHARSGDRDPAPGVRTRPAWLVPKAREPSASPAAHGGRAGVEYRGARARTSHPRCRSDLTRMDESCLVVLVDDDRAT
jgi:hypothetical protein